MSAAPSPLRGYGAPLKPVEALAVLVARVRDCAGLAERLPLQRELERIADQLIAVRKAIMVMAEPEADPNPPVSAHDRRVRAKNPEPGMRICSRCRTKLPIDLFSITDKRTGKRPGRLQAVLQRRPTHPLRTGRVQDRHGRGDGRRPLRRAPLPGMR